MEILAELHPKSKREKIEKEIKELESFDGFDIPDSPIGLPSPLPSVIATIIRGKYADKRIIVNQRLLDVNELFLASLSLTSKLIDFDIAFTRGDKPKIGKEVGYLTSEQAILLSKKFNKDLKVGLMISLRKEKEDIIRRLNFEPADFFLVLRLESDTQLDGLPTSKLIPYVIIRTEKNKEIANTLSQPVIDENKALDFIYKLEERKVQGVLLSALGDNEALNRIIIRY
ncbi:hypothetical protein [Sulfurisphaera javensis]